jgi:hypothetical protein
MADIDPKDPAPALDGEQPKLESEVEKKEEAEIPSKEYVLANG